MSIDLAQTPTIQAVATADESSLVADLEQRVATAVRQAESQPEVVTAAENQHKTAQRLAALSRAQRALNGHAKVITERTGAVREHALDSLIASAADGGKLDFKPLNDLLVLEHRGRYVSRALERLVETQLPLAQVAQMREESHAAMVLAKALEQGARERAERLLDQLRDAVNEEVVLPVDMSKGVSGALLAQAAEHRRRALAISENADRLEKTFMGRQ